MISDVTMSDNGMHFPQKTATTVASCVTVYSLLTVLFNFYVCYSVYRRRGLRSSSTEIIVANLACVDILVTLKDMPMFIAVAKTGQWYFEETWCSTYGLTNVVFIIVSVSSLITVTTEKYVRLRDGAGPQGGYHQNRSKPLLLGYVIAHTTLSYSLSLLWSKYIFLTRKAFCRVEWPPKKGFSFTFFSSFVFIVPVSLLIYNLLYRGVVVNEDQEDSDCGMNNKKALEVAEEKESLANSHLQIAVTFFLISWSPYVIESIISGYIDLPPLLSICTACFPILATSMLPFVYVRFLKEEPYIDTPKLLTVHVQ
eukprot:gene7215-8023_t